MKSVLCNISFENYLGSAARSHHTREFTGEFTGERHRGFRRRGHDTTFEERHRGFRRQISSCWAIWHFSSSWVRVVWNSSSGWAHDCSRCSRGLWIPLHVRLVSQAGEPPSKSSDSDWWIQSWGDQAGEPPNKSADWRIQSWPEEDLRLPDWVKPSVHPRSD